MQKAELDFSGSWKNTPAQGGRKRPAIFLFRHGQSFYNRKHYFTGWKDSKLTPLGKKQAGKIGKMLRDEKIDIAIVTSLSRSKETMAEVLKHHPECERIFTDDRMVERSYGQLSGKSHEVFVREHSEDELKEIRRSYSHVPPGGESVEMVERRVLAFIRDLLAYVKRYGVNVAISAHGNSMRPFRRYFEKMTVGQMMGIENPWDDYFKYEIK